MTFSETFALLSICGRWCAFGTCPGPSVNSLISGARLQCKLRGTHSERRLKANNIPIDIAVCHFALQYARSQSNSTTWSSNNYCLEYRELKCGERSRRKSVSASLQTFS